MEKPACKNCAYWLSKGPRVEFESDVGECHFAPPMLRQPLDKDEFLEDSYFLTGWPVTNGDEFCGKHPDFLIWMAEQRGS